MPRNLPAPMIAAAPSAAVSFCYLLDLQLVSGTEHVWTGFGSITWNGVTYKSVGSFAVVGDITEGSDVRADGTTVGLSGIDPTLLSESLNDIQQGAPATLWLALFSAGAIVGTPYQLFVGTVDKPTVDLGVETVTIQIALETRMANLQRASNRRYTLADQRYYYPDDIGLSWVETLNDVALIWG